jgi:NAD(P)-dependent dehydrogenase (short-subunit alcohol dehydrogenase family)
MSRRTSGLRSTSVTPAACARSAVHATVQRFGKIDVLINNAGYSRGMSADIALAQAEGVWDEELGVNLKGAFLMALAVAPYLPRPGGRIINMSSDGVFTGGIGLRTLGYITAKAGVLGRRAHSPANTAPGESRSMRLRLASLRGPAQPGISRQRS